MKLTIVCGSHRANSQSLKVSNYLASESKTTYDTVTVINLAETQIPFWDEGVWSNPMGWNQNWNNVKAQLAQADALIYVTPEYAGMPSPRLKNLILLCSVNELAHKPCLLVAVSSGINGAYPIAELRATSSKNNKACYIPDHLIIREAEARLMGAASESDKHEIGLRKRISFSLNALAIYSRAFAEIRKALPASKDEFKYGM